jgi:hypothetical protein
MATEVLQECRLLSKLAKAGLLDLVLQYTSKSEAHLAVSPNALPGLPVESIGDNTLPGLSAELIGKIASHLDSASLHNLHNTTKWLAAAVDYHYTKRHPTHTICHDAKQLPGFIKQLTMPAICMHINRLEMTGGMSAEAYPAFQSIWLPSLSELVFVGIEMDGPSLLSMCIYNRLTLRSLSIDNVYLEDSGCWESLFFAIMRLLRLEVLRVKGLSYKSDFTGFLSRVCFPLEDRFHGLEGAEGIKGNNNIYQLMDQYFRDRNKLSFRREMVETAPIFLEATSVRVIQARGLHNNTR